MAETKGNHPGRAADDTPTGDDGNDTFVCQSGDGLDTIDNFNAGSTGPINDGDSTNNDFIDMSGYCDDIRELRDDFDDDGILNQSNATTNGGTAETIPTMINSRPAKMSRSRMLTEAASLQKIQAPCVSPQVR